MSTARIQLFSPLSPTECAVRLTEAIEPERAIFSLGIGSEGKPVVGHVSERGIRLRKRIGYRNSLQIEFEGTLKAEAGGTLISGEFAMNPYVIFLFVFWFGACLLMGGTMFVMTLSAILSDAEKLKDAWIGLVGPPAMLAFGVGIFFFKGEMSRGHDEFITNFLMRTLGAERR